MYIFSGSSNLSLAKKISQQADFKLGKIELSRFDNDEVRVRIKEKNVGEKCVVVQSLSQPTDHNLVELLMISDALKRKGVKQILGVVPWLGYSKQDKVFREGEPLSVAVVARVLKTAGMSQLVTVDLHNEGIKKYFKIPVVNLSALDLLAGEVEPEKDLIVVAPDKGSVTKSKLLAEKLASQLVVIDKERDLRTGEVRVVKMKGEVKGKKVVMFDDMIATGGTLIKIVKYLKSRGVQSIKVLVTHHLYVKGVQDRLDKSQIDELVVTDSVEQKDKSAKLKVVSLAKLIAKEIKG